MMNFRVRRCTGTAEAFGPRLCRWQSTASPLGGSRGIAVQIATLGGWPGRDVQNRLWRTGFFSALGSAPFKSPTGRAPDVACDQHIRGGLGSPDAAVVPCDGLVADVNPQLTRVGAEYRSERL